MLHRLSLAFALLLAAFTGPLSAEPLLVKGSATSTAPVAAAAPMLKQLGIDLRIDREQNTSTAIATLATGGADLALATRPLTSAERAAYPNLRLDASPMAYQVLALVVPIDVWNKGVRSLT